MKIAQLLAVATATLAFCAASQAAVDADAATKMTKDKGCTKCHSVDKTKKGPPFKKTAAKYKGKSEAEGKLYEYLTKTSTVKLDDGTEEEHKALNPKDAAEIKNLIQYILAQ